MAVMQLKKIQRLFGDNLTELKDFPDLVNIVKGKIEAYNSKLKNELQERIVSLIFHKFSDEINTNIFNKGKFFTIKLILHVVIQNNKDKKEENIEVVEDFFDLVARKEFKLNDNITTNIAKTLSRRNRQEDINSIKTIIQKYQEEQREGGYNIEHPEYNMNQEIVQKLNLFFNDLSDPQTIISRKESYLVS